MSRTLLLSICVGCGLAEYAYAAAPGEPVAHRWKAQPDAVYLQEVGRTISSDTPVRAVAVYDTKLYAGFDDGVRVLEGDGFKVVVGAPQEAVRRIVALDGALWVIADKGLHRFVHGAWSVLFTGPCNDVVLHLGKVHVATSDGLMSVDGNALRPVPDGKGLAGAQRLASYSETLYGLAPGRLGLFDGKSYQTEIADWGELPSESTRDMLAWGSRLVVATDRGVAMLRGMSMTTITGKDGLCYEDTTCLAEGFADDLWIGTTRGAIRWVNGEFQYFAAERWLPNDHVNAIVCGERAAYIATDKGLGIVEYEPYTLAKKAAYYERHLEEWGQKRLGFVYKLEYNESKGGWVREISDNDGGWTAEYLAAMSYKYAVTGDEAARKEAVNSFKSLRWLVSITGVPGFPARAIMAKGEVGNQSGGEWHDTADGQWQWKGDTSSDETDAHFYCVSIFHDLAAKGEEKKQAADHLAGIASHVIDNGWVLRGPNGQPTTWGRWDPEYLQRPKGFYARGLNGMEALCMMRTAAALSGDPKFDTAYKTLLDWKYPIETIRQKLTFPPDFIFHSDDRLAFFAYFPLLRYEKEPQMRSIYVRSLERSWEIERIEQNPWFNFIYGALTGNDCEADRAAKHLREWPLDMINWSFHNSHRQDLVPPSGYVPYSGGAKPLSPRDRGPMRWTDSTLGPNGGSSGREVVDPSGWLTAYWMGRYFGFIEPPAVKARDLISVKPRGEHFGAKPYAGPPRPE
ncbi:MAG: hypothetical protein HZB26_08480 [Candidatus Hydrogenedentes bacterium]|nr:hypothetical protein [Candidatus Hydrogenedentota bacterium]